MTGGTLTSKTTTEGAATVELSSPALRSMTRHIIWDKLQTFAEELHGLDWPLIKEEAEEAIDTATYCSRMIGEYGRCLIVAEDPESEAVTLPMKLDALRHGVEDFIKGIYENDLREKGVSTADLRMALDYMDAAKVYLETIGGPASEKVPA